MPVFNFDLEDGKPPVTFNLKPEDAARFMGFMAQCEGDQKDAARYRWLRDKAPGEIHFDHTEDNYYFELNVPFDGEPINDNEESARRLDASIDAQIVADRIGAA